MQQFVVIYSKKDDLGWHHTFVKKKKEALDRAQTKCQKEMLDNVWICDWKDLKATPQILIGDPTVGVRIVESLVNEIRKAYSKDRPPAKLKRQIPALFTTVKPPEVKVEPVVTMPIVEVKEQSPKPSVFKAKTTSEYKRPYDVKKAE